MGWSSVLTPHDGCDGPDTVCTANASHRLIVPRVADDALTPVRSTSQYARLIAMTTSGDSGEGPREDQTPPGGDEPQPPADQEPTQIVGVPTPPPPRPPAPGPPNAAAARGRPTPPPAARPRPDPDGGIRPPRLPPPGVHPAPPPGVHPAPPPGERDPPGRLPPAEFPPCVIPGATAV